MYVPVLSDTGSSPALALDFLSGSVDPRLTFARLATAKYYNSAGLLTSAGVNVLRFDYDPATLLPRGVLIEESRQNLTVQSNQFDTTWTLDTNASVTAASGVSPDGTTNAWKLTENSTTAGQHRALQSITKAASALSYVGTVFAKAVERSRIFVSLVSGANGVSAVFDLVGGQVGVTAFAFGVGFTVGSSSIQNVGNSGWYRCTTVATSDTTTTIQPQVGLDSALGTAAGVSSYAGTIGSGVLIYGAQLEQATFPTSYIPTAASAVTRNADNLSMARSAFAFNGAAGTFAINYIPVVAGPNFATRGELLSMDDVSQSRLSIRGFDTSVGSYPTAVVGDGVSNLNVTPINTQTVGVLNKFALSYGQTVASVALNGGAVASLLKASADSGWTTMGIGNSGGSVFMTMWIQSITYYTTSSADTKLQFITT